MATPLYIDTKPQTKQTDILCKALTGPTLCLDIGSGTQDVFLALPDKEPENWPRFVLPAPARVVAKQIAELTAAGRPIWLHGTNMGGGFFGALKAHMAAGLAVAAHPDATAAIHDSVEKVRELGVTVCDACPAGYAPVMLADYEAGFWRGFLSMAGLPLPTAVLASAQDHGVHPELGNRIGRFQLFKDFVASGGDIASLLYATPPATYTRLAALQASIGGGLVSDTGVAAVLGALSMPEVAKRSHREGVMVVNVGNSHVIAFLIYKERVTGVYEHHTGMHDTASLAHDLQEFRMAWLPDEEVRAKGGHGCVFAPDMPAEAEGYRPTFILGPRRAMLQGHGSFIAPHGDMMLAGCYGLLYGLALQSGNIE